MTAGSGIIHGKMPPGDRGRLHGFQLWVNLPKANKMMPPRYRDVRKETTPPVRKESVEIKVIVGSIDGVQGPVKDLIVSVEYRNVKLGSGGSLERNVTEGWACFACVFEGEASFGSLGSRVGREDLVAFGDRGTVRVASQKGARLLLVSDRPVKEPMAWRGPVVMNTEDEQLQAFEVILAGTFVKR
jgi:redox-sensitive bicupin YhaK (pirin superfamily)